MVNSSLHIPWMYVSRGVRLSSLKCIAVAAAIQRSDERYICMKKLTPCLTYWSRLLYLHSRYRNKITTRSIIDELVQELWTITHNSIRAT